MGLDWKQIAVGVGGAVLAPFTGGASIPIAGAIASGMNTNSAAKDINQQQQAGTNQANAALKPYMDIGSQAQNTLGGLFGFGRPSGMGSGLSVRNSWDPEIGVGEPGDPAKGGLTPYNPQTLRTLADGAQITGKAQARDSAQQQTTSGFGSIRMRAPNGQTYMVPQQHVQQAEAEGGQRL